MHPEQIKASMRMNGTTPSALADSILKSRMLVSNVIHGRSTSRLVATSIAQILGVSVDHLWPGKYKQSKHTPVPAARHAATRIERANSRSKGGRA